MTKREGPTRHIFITGGVVSSLGKGIATASIGRILVNMGFSVRIQKLDPYLNVDPGTMNPFQHGEVYVTDDGAETDLDLGHYERFLGTPCSKLSTVTSGRIYQTVLNNERAGKYNGGTVQVIPHVTDEIKKNIRALHAPDVDVVISEIGGTVGDIEGLPFMEAVRQFRHEAGRANCCCIHLAYIPFIRAAGEIKTKPAQHSVQKLREIGIIPDFLLCRAEKPLGKSVRDKLALFCNVDLDKVIDLVDVPTSIYEVPQVLMRQGMDTLLADQLRLPKRACDMRDWDLMINHIKKPKDTVRIALVGKYIDHQDAYKSVTESIDHAAYAHLLKAEIVRLESEDLEKPDGLDLLKGIDGILVPGGFGKHPRSRTVPGHAGCDHRIRTQRRRTRASQLGGDGREDAASDHRRDGDAEGVHRLGHSRGHDASGCLYLHPAQEIEPYRQIVWRRGRGQRTASPSLRIQQRLPYPFRRSRDGVQRRLHPRRQQARAEPGGNRRVARASVLRGHAGASRIQEQPGQTAPPLPRLPRCRLQAQAWRSDRREERSGPDAGQWLNERVRIARTATTTKTANRPRANRMKKAGV
jgi:hypothetical protein